MALGEPIRDRRQERHQATRAEIVDAAWEIARTEGLAGVSLRDLARAVGMQPPSLYSYFESKNAIYDAMYAQGYAQMLRRNEVFDATPGTAAFKAVVRAMIEFCAEDPARYQLMFQRNIPGFTPSAESYALALEALDRTHRSLAAHGITSTAHRDLFTALASGLVDQQIANDPGGTRWLRLVDQAADMFLAHTKSSSSRRRTMP